MSARNPARASSTYAAAAPLATIVFAALLACPAIAAPRASFDCRKAREGAEQAICASEALARRDVAVARASERLTRALDPQAQAALKTDQESFVAARDQAFGLPNEDIDARLAERLAFLSGVRTTPPEGLIGWWGNLLGEIEVAMGEDGRLTIMASTIDPVGARWACDVGGSGSLAAGALTIATSEDPDEQGWTLTLTPAGRLLLVAETPPAGAAEPGRRPYCGANGATAGTYFPLTGQPERRRLRSGSEG